MDEISDRKATAIYYAMLLTICTMAGFIGAAVALLASK